MKNITCKCGNKLNELDLRNVELVCKKCGSVYIIENDSVKLKFILKERKKLLQE